MIAILLPAKLIGKMCHKVEVHSSRCYKLKIDIYMLPSAVKWKTHIRKGKGVVVLSNFVLL